MERGREENSSGDAECRRNQYIPPTKTEGLNIIESPVVSESGRSSFLGCPPNVYVDSLESTVFNRGVTSLAGSEQQWPNNFHGNDTKLIVEESSARTCTIPNSIMVNSLDSEGKKHHKHGQWPHLYQLAGVSKSITHLGGSSSNEKDHMMFRVREDLKRLPSDIQDLQFQSRKRTKHNSEEISAHLSDDYNKIISSNALPLSNTGSNVAPTSCFFPQFSVEKTFKGKGVASSNQEVHSESDVVSMSHKGETPDNKIRVASDILLSSRADSNRLDSTQDWIRLRDRLKPGCCRLNKDESLHVFKKIVEFVDFAHCQGVSLQDLRPSCFILLPSNKVKYTGPLPQIDIQDVMNDNMNKKMPLVNDENDKEALGYQFWATHKRGFWNKPVDVQSTFASGGHWSNAQHKAQINFSYQNASTASQQSSSLNVQLEKKWYAAPEDDNEGLCTFAANIYSLGVLLFELLCYFESWEKHSAVMWDMQRRIFPPTILSEYPIEAGFCLWLLHPHPSSRPMTREILQSELLCGLQKFDVEKDLAVPTENEIADLEILLHFLTLMKEQKQKLASKLAEDLGCLEQDLKDANRRNSSKKSLNSSCTYENITNSGLFGKSISELSINEAKMIKSMSQLENAYFSMRSQTHHKNAITESRADNDLLKNWESLSQVENKSANPYVNEEPTDRIEPFFQGICKFVCYSKLEVCGTLRKGDLFNSSNVICSLSVDRDDDYIAAAGVSKKIKIFDCNALLDDTIDVHYPVVEMSNKSKLSCVCWNNYIRNYLASTDYDGTVQMWDANTGQDICQYSEHQKRAWSVDFSQIDPTKFASGSDDCSVKLWSINEKNSTSSIRNPANICCVQFSSYSSQLLAYGSADYKIYCYDLRHTRIPWCTLAGHRKTVSYVRFVDSDTLVSASTDNTLKLWDLNKTSPSGLSDIACSLTFNGHTNEKNFVGLSALDGYIACGSESNEVFTYCKYLPMPITSYKFVYVDPISGHEIVDDNSQFVSSVCWRRKSKMIVAANSTGNIKLLQMV